MQNEKLYSGPMKLADIQSEVMHWPDVEVDTLSAFLTMLRLKRSHTEMEEFGRRLDDKRPESWMSLDDLKTKLTAEEN